MADNAKSRRVILDLAITLDGYIEGENGEIDWCIMDNEMGFIDFLNQIDTIFYGRKSYVRKTIESSIFYLFHFMISITMKFFLHVNYLFSSKK